MNTTNNIILATALNSIILTAQAQSTAEPIVSQEVEKSYGIQKKMNTCAIDKSDIEAANKAFQNKYKKHNI